MAEPEWRRDNRANWDERVPVHLGPRGYALSDLRAGRGRLGPIEQRELPDVAGKRIAHLQCHFGADSLRLAQQGADVVGLDFSAPAVAAARGLAAELGLVGRASFVEADLYDAVRAIPPPHAFDIVFASWGAITWLPDIRGWAQVAAALLRPGGSVYLADGHPAAYVFDDAAAQPDGMPGFFAPYASRDPVIVEDARDYSDPDARLTHTRQHNWIHPLGEVVTALIDAGMRLEWLHEHDAVTWPMFRCLVPDGTGLYRWPGKPWLPLSFSLWATRNGW